MAPPVDVITTPLPVETLASKKRRGFRQHGPALREGWQDKLVRYLEQYGTYAKACRHAGVSDETVRQARHKDPAFDLRCHEAREIHADTCEEKLEAQSERSDNPVGLIVRLKAIRPERYIERHAVMNFNVSTQISDQDALPLLRAMLADLTPTSQAALMPAAKEETT